GGRQPLHVAEIAIALEDVGGRMADALGHVAGAVAARRTVRAAGPELVALVQGGRPGRDRVDYPRLPEELFDRLTRDVDQRGRGADDVGPQRTVPAAAGERAGDARQLGEPALVEERADLLAGLPGGAPLRRRHGASAGDGTGMGQRRAEGADDREAEGHTSED